jgi:tetratricopeptide (TPR) repeat protein
MRALPLAAILVLTFAAPTLALRGAAEAGQSADNDVLPPPAMPAFPIPPGVGVFGPDGPQSRAGEPLTMPYPAETSPAESLPAAEPAKPTLRQTRAQILDELFGRLAQSTDADAAKGIAGAIERVWMHSGSDTADLLMQRALSALNGEDYALAERVLDAIVVIDPDWAEGWDQRATERFVTDDYAGAMQDISHVLAIEPRHFGALSGMGFILQKTGFDKEALQVFRRTLEIYPQQESIRKIVDDLTIEVEGRDI